MVIILTWNLIAAADLDALAEVSLMLQQMSKRRLIWDLTSFASVITFNSTPVCV